ncbi:hypothetical protein P780_15905, partial [Vibrio mimicus CAIM 1882]
MLKHRNLLAFSNFETAEHSTLSTNQHQEKLKSQM